jgi:hypothetical protein
MAEEELPPRWNRGPMTWGRRWKLAAVVAVIPTALMMIGPLSAVFELRGASPWWGRLAEIALAVGLAYAMMTAFCVFVLLVAEGRANWDRRDGTP